MPACRGIKTISADGVLCKILQSRPPPQIKHKIPTSKGAVAPQITKRSFRQFRATLPQVVLDESDWDFESKLTLLRKAHEEDLQHSGGANGLQSSLVEAMGGWTHLDLDAVYFTARCSHCCRSTTRASCNAAAPPRTLPGKLEALNVVGMDLKTMSGDEGLPPWTLLVLVCFASTKIWTKDFDGGPVGKGGATLAGSAVVCARLDAFSNQPRPCCMVGRQWGSVQECYQRFERRPLWDCTNLHPARSSSFQWPDGAHEFDAGSLRQRQVEAAVGDGCPQQCMQVQTQLPTRGPI